MGIAWLLLAMVPLWHQVAAVGSLASWPAALNDEMRLNIGTLLQATEKKRNKQNSLLRFSLVGAGETKGERRYCNNKRGVCL